MDEICTLSPIGILGYGINEESVARTVEEFDVDVIAVDGGSMDPGPNYFGRGVNFADEAMVERDLRILLNARERLDVPLLVSTAGGCGSGEHLDATADILGNIADEQGRSLDVARIYTDVEKGFLKGKVRDGEVGTLSYDEPLTESMVDDAERIVAQVGPRPYIDALAEGADVVLGGRSIDLAPFSAIPLREGFDPGLTYHQAKILECATHATESGSGDDALVGRLDEDGFEVVPANPDRACTVESVAAHTMYEKSDPFTIHVPDGEVDVSECSFEQVAPRRVRVENSTFERTDPHSVLLEGVELRGYRTITPSGIRDPAVIDNVEELTEKAADRVARTVDVDPDAYDLQFRTYGVDAVPLTPVADGGSENPTELGVTIDVVAETQEAADTVCALARSTLLHQPFEGRTATGGNLALPYSPSDVSMGSVYEFSIYHLAADVEPGELATLETEVVR